MGREHLFAETSLLDYQDTNAIVGEVVRGLVLLLTSVGKSIVAAAS